MSSSDNDENDKKLDDLLKKLGKNFEDFIKRERNDIMQRYQYEFDEATRLAEECSKKEDFVSANIHYERAIHANDLMKSLRSEGY
jgi:hypothetical protein